MATYRVMCEYKVQSSVAYVSASSAAEAVQKCMALHGVIKAYILDMPGPRREADF